MLRYDIRRYLDGWAIIDTSTDEPIILNGQPQTGFSIEGAQDFVNILNGENRRNRFKFGNVIVWNMPTEAVA
jgi:hypothetical protein